AGDSDTRPRVGCGLRRGIGLGKIPVFLLLLLLQDAAERQHLHLREGQVRRGQERGAVLVHLRPPAAGRRRRQQGKGMAGRHAQQSRATPASTGKLQRGLGQARHTRGVGRQAKQHNVPFAKGHGASGLCPMVGVLGGTLAVLPLHRPHQGRERRHTNRQGRGRHTNDSEPVASAESPNIVTCPLPKVTVLLWVPFFDVDVISSLRLPTQCVLFYLYFAASKNLSSVNIPNLCRRNFPSFILTVFSAVHQYFVVPRGAGQLLLRWRACCVHEGSEVLVATTPVTLLPYRCCTPPLRSE
ncbi:Hypothetical protein, putative, partial [Bodo saltans]